MKIKKRPDVSVKKKLKIKKHKVTPFMTRMPADYSPKTTGITASLLTKFLRCRKAFMFAVNLWGGRETSIRTFFGSLMHEVLGLIHGGEAIVNERKIDVWIDLYVEEHQDEVRGKPAQELEMEKALAFVMACEYQIFYAKDFKNKKFTDIEKEFDIRLAGFRLLGKKDARFRDKSKKRWIMETKTKSRLQEDKLLLQLNMDLQNLFYVVTDEAEFKEEVIGVLYNIIRRPGHRKGKKESLKDFIKRVRKEVHKDPKHFFIRFEVPYTKRDKIRFAYDLGAILQEVEEFAKGHLEPYSNRTSCMGTYACDYLAACASNNFVSCMKRDKLFPELEGGS